MLKVGVDDACSDTLKLTLPPTVRSRRVIERFVGVSRGKPRRPWGDVTHARLRPIAGHAGGAVDLDPVDGTDRSRQRAIKKA
jgi:hypothetical protein